MGGKTKIAWTESTWNPVSGCTKASPGCAHCYAERLAKRLPASHAVGHSFSEVVCHPERLDVPLRWRRPRRVFVCSMGDLFHPDVPDRFIEQVWAMMLLSPRHTFQVLTKRPERMLAFLSSPRLYDRVLHAASGFRVANGRYDLCGIGISNPATHPRNWIWLGVTAEDQQRADERIPLLLQCPAAVRFVSVEPMLGPIDLGPFPLHWRAPLSPLVGTAIEGKAAAGLDWIICGGESGPGARPMHVEWARSLRDQCVGGGVPFMFKQWGEWCNGGTAEGSESMRRVGKRAAGRLLDGVTHDEYPEARP